MSLESATTISGLQSSNPAGSDSQLQGYQHLQLIKNVLKLQFPGIGGAGFNVPITAKEVELNSLVGVTSNVQGQLNFIQSEILALQAQGSFPTGTRIVFAQSTAPIGWTQVTTWTNHMLRVVASAGGGFGGTMSPILNNVVPAHTHSVITGFENVSHTHTFTGTAVADHTHTSQKPVTAAGNQSGTGGFITTAVADVTGAAGGHTPSGTIGTESAQHTHSGTAALDPSAANWTPQYVDTIICEKQ